MACLQKFILAVPDHEMKQNSVGVLYIHLKICVYVFINLKHYGKAAFVW